jgi:hypothetical protein
MVRWITDRTQPDVDRVKEITAKARTGTWTKAEQLEWLAGMKGALSYTDFNRIESGIQELSVRTDWTVDGYMKVSDTTRWLSNINSIRAKCSGPSGIADTPESMNKLDFSTMNQIEQILFDIETLAKTYVTFSGEYMTGDGQYGF